MRNSVYGLDYYLFNTRNPRDNERDLCEKAYRFWKSSWLETYRSLGVEKSSFFSDDFLDRELSALFYQGEPVALFFNNFFDMTRESIAEHSYFKNHPGEVIDFLRKKNFKEVMFLSYMTVHSEWRTSRTDVPLPELLFSLAIKRFLDLGQTALSGYIRTDKSFYSSFYNHGAEKILSAVAYNAPVDFCYLTSKTAKLSDDPAVRNACHFLWAGMQARSLASGPKALPLSFEDSLEEI